MKGKENKKVKEASQKDILKDEKQPMNSSEKQNTKEINRYPKSGKGL